LTGIGIGVFLLGVLALRGVPVPKASNWGVGVGLGSSLIQYEVCQGRRRSEKMKMQRVVEVYSQTQAERKREKMEADRIAAEKEAQDKAKRSWFRIW
jgi:cytochrome c oxidase assembly protein subunit 20